ncbi:DNA-binding transcriptional activator MhpR [Delftia tsuruhatensis]|uniref:IclR family transcriptional regulator n=1 Tax=Delftia tsuruhatensis TaxID=180282 RepID=UPI001E7AA208|nr:helix-turn-helix domain-containing protein [Delftia tsuruhatensis]CAB5674871.1 DNA-binding transcriptional activator MhpR [Delftia tsuruhatensis]CAC9692559.1 DNA-binding transcriptional activator MhpR [Delftia tsuruhatensis]
MTQAPIAHQPRDSQDVCRIREQDPYFAGTLAKGLMILQCFVSDPRPHANSELARRLGLPRPTVSRLCRSLQTMGYLDHDERLDRYFVGPAAVALGYPYVINTPQLAQLRLPMQALADRVKGAVSVGVAMDLDVVYLETCAWEGGTLKRPGVGAVRGVLETAMGRAGLAQLGVGEQQHFLQRVQHQRPDEYARCLDNARESIARYQDRGFAVNMGDSGLGVCAVGAASRIRYGTRRLLFNCAVPGLRMPGRALVRDVGPQLAQLVALCDRLPADR